MWLNGLPYFQTFLLTHSTKIYEKFSSHTDLIYSTPSLVILTLTSSVGHVLIFPRSLEKFLKSLVTFRRPPVDSRLSFFLNGKS